MNWKVFQMPFEAESTILPVVIESNLPLLAFHTTTTQDLTPQESHSDILQLTDIIAPVDDITIVDGAFNSNADRIDMQSIQEDFSTFKASDQSFLIIDLGFTQEQLNLLSKIDITQQQEYNNFGKLESLNGDIQNFLKEISTANEQEINIVSQMIEKLSTDIIKILGKESAWVALRGFTENHAFDIPRWHIDGYFNEAQTGSNFEVKFGTALIGPQTIFYPLAAESREAFFDHESNRNELDDLYPVQNAISAEPGQGAFFVVGNQQRAAIHSEPRMENSRLFLSIVAGSHEEIRSLDKRLNRITIHDHVNSHKPTMNSKVGPA